MSVSITSPQSKLVTTTEFPDIKWICSTEGQKYYEIQYRFKNHGEWSTCGKVESTNNYASMKAIYDIVGTDFYEIYYRVIIYYDGYNVIGPIKGKDVSLTYSVMFMHGIAGTLQVYDGGGILKYNYFDQINRPPGVDSKEVEVLNIALDQEGTKIAKVPLVDKQSVIASNFLVNIDSKTDLDQKAVAKDEAKFIANYIPSETNIYQTAYYYTPIYQYADMDVYYYVADYSYNPVYDTYRDYEYGYYISSYYNDKYEYVQPAGYTYYNQQLNYYTTYNIYAYRYYSYYTYYTEPASSEYNYYNAIAQYGQTSRYIDSSIEQYGFSTDERHDPYITGYTINYNTLYSYLPVYGYRYGTTPHSYDRAIFDYYTDWIQYNYLTVEYYTYNHIYQTGTAQESVYSRYYGYKYKTTYYSYKQKDSTTGYNTATAYDAYYRTEYGYKYGGTRSYWAMAYEKLSHGYRTFYYKAYSTYNVKYSYGAVAGYYKYNIYSTYNYYYYSTQYGSNTSSYKYSDYKLDYTSYYNIYATQLRYGSIGYTKSEYKYYNQSYFYYTNYTFYTYYTYEYVSGYQAYVSGYSYKDTTTHYAYNTYYVYYYYPYYSTISYIQYYNYVTGYYNEYKHYVHNYTAYIPKLNYDSLAYHSDIGYNIYYYYQIDAYYNDTPTPAEYYVPRPIYSDYTRPLDTYTSYIKYMYAYIAGYHSEYSFTYNYSYLGYYTITEYNYSYYS